MYRNCFEKLLAWKTSSRRKPLIIKGARQVGKTWLMNEFAEKEYDDAVYINFDRDAQAADIFRETKDPKQLIERLSLIHGKVIMPENTLIILDEIQECPDALGSLKYFNEQANEYHIVTAGSLLGTHLSKPASYPVGKVNLLDIYPLSFDEYLAATDSGMYQYLTSLHSRGEYISAFHSRMIDLYKRYLIIGGMPECVQSWIDNADPEELQAIQKEILTIYERAFTKHNGKVNSGRILQVFRSIIPQLAKENNEKFMYSAIAKSARTRDFEDAIEWLVSSGIVYKVNNVAKADYPLKTYEIFNCFKLFLLDVGIIKHMANLTNESIMLSEHFQFKGQLTENYVLQQLLPLMGSTPNYYSFAQNRELDFILQHGDCVIPVEVKSGGSKHAVSFKSFISKYHPKTAVRFNTNGYTVDGAITNIPLYLVGKVFELV